MRILKNSLTVLFALCFAIAPFNSSRAEGKHYGELKMMEADISFIAPDGITVASENGLIYYFAGFTYLDPSLVYPSVYWGTFPLYIPGNLVQPQIVITNNGPRAIAKHTIVAEAYALNLDGSAGLPIMTPQVIEYDNYGNPLDVALGETKAFNVTFTLPAFGQKGLNLFIINLYHHNNDNNNASLIMSKEGIFCPPEYLDTLDVYAPMD